MVCLENLEQGRLSFVSDDRKKSLWQMAKLLRSQEKGRVVHRSASRGKEEDVISIFSSLTQHWNYHVVCEGLFTQIPGDNLNLQKIYHSDCQNSLVL